MASSVKVYVTTFSVGGRSDFPLDMLRYDNCYPARSEDAAAIVATIARYDGEHETIKLEKRHAGKDPNLTPDRWASFVWSLDRDSIETIP